MAKAEAAVIDGDVLTDDTPRPRNALTAPVSRSPSVGQTDPMMILAVAVKNKSPVEVIERIVALQERIMTFEARRSFNQAIADARGEIPVIVKNRRVQFESKKQGAADTDYAHEDLAQIATQIDPVLAKFGLSYRFKSRQEGTKLTLTCILSHRDGHVEDAGELAMHNDTSGNKGEAQGIGSAATYLERYTLKMSLGLAAAEDDDARKAREIERKPPPVPSAGATPSAGAAPSANTQSGPYKLPTEGMKFAAWGKLYVEKIKTADTVKVLLEWDELNSVALDVIFNADKAVHAEIDKAFLTHKAHLEAKKRPSRQDPISSGPQKQATPGIPDIETEYEDWLKWAHAQIEAQTDPDVLETLYNNMIDGQSGVFPSDRDKLTAAYQAKHKALTTQ